MLVIRYTLRLPSFFNSQNSQSQRILWLLEELNIPHNLVLYERDQGHRAPPDLSKIHPLGKAPILVTTDGRTVAESSAIALYLLNTYDKEGKFTSHNDALRDEQLTSFANNSLGIVNALQLFVDLMASASPFFVKPITNAIKGKTRQTFTHPEYEKMLAYLENELEGREYFMGGSQPGRADFMMSWPLDNIVQRKMVSNLDVYPKVKAWHERCQSRPAWKKALERGNGYDLTSFK